MKLVPGHILFVLGLTACPPPAPTVAPHRGPPPTSCYGGVASDTTLYDTTAIDERPLPRLAPVLLPRPDSAERGERGRVKVAAIVGSDGAIEPTSVGVITSDYVSLRSAGEEAVKGITYWPGCRAGHPVRVRLAIDVEFQSSSGGGDLSFPLWAAPIYVGALVVGFLVLFASAVK